MHWPVCYFNPRSLTGATHFAVDMPNFDAISIHAPSRERLVKTTAKALATRFQSTLPHGSDVPVILMIFTTADFNPRSLTGATQDGCRTHPGHSDFNPRSLTGATTPRNLCIGLSVISIHAPSRERRILLLICPILTLFQSTLPHGSDATRYASAAS